MSAQKPLDGRRIGLVGLGRRGLAVARKLTESGARLHVWTQNTAKAVGLAEAHPLIEVEPCPRDVARYTEATLVAVNNDSALERVVFDPDEDRYGALHGTPPEGLIVDIGETTPQSTRNFADRVRQSGRIWIDAPITEAALGGTLSAGGTDMAFARIWPVLRVLAAKALHAGPVGAGQAIRTCSAAIHGQMVQALAEGLALAAASGVEAEALLAALADSAVGGAVLNETGRRMADREFRAGRTVRMQAALTDQAEALAGAAGLSLGGLKSNAAHWNALVENGQGDLDISSLILEIAENPKDPE
ncbi:NAD(P)-binding domain-containing protein [Nisaea acidiphila]|uniref:NAD(P)-binding domain-containing protein n=1 Tax=Nisaea acidiphila TaxID=1862145 RepID=A0A9J7AV62_9PROT|nr:NAD(P)-binding domain-containing protein [Nisaea acidiphila]UUX51651.1 NAD(P)-binding domain-containing protein [Nisaea acidiphila]